MTKILKPKKPATTKKPKIKVLSHDEVARRLQLLRRLESADKDGYCRCVTCGVVKHYTDGIHGGHFIERTKLATKLEKSNIHPQCANCNIGTGKYGKNSISYKYMFYMMNTYGLDFVKDLMKQSEKKGFKFKKGELESMLLKIEEKITFHEKRLHS